MAEDQSRSIAIYMMPCQMALGRGARPRSAHWLRRNGECGICWAELLRRRERKRGDYTVKRVREERERGELCQWRYFSIDYYYINVVIHEYGTRTGLCLQIFSLKICQHLHLRGWNMLLSMSYLANRSMLLLLTNIKSSLQNW